MIKKTHNVNRPMISQRDFPSSFLPSPSGKYLEIKYPLNKPTGIFAAKRGTVAREEKVASFP